MWKQIFLSSLILLIASSCYGAITEGTSAGFVTTSPSADPNEGSAFRLDDFRFATKYTSPADIDEVTEMGYWCSEGGDSKDISHTVYTHDAENDRPNVPLSTTDFENQSNNVDTWNKQTLSISVSASTTYWLYAAASVATDNFDVGRETGTAHRSCYKIGGDTTPDNPWQNSADLAGHIYAIYALYTTAGPKKGQVMKLRLF